MYLSRSPDNVDNEAWGNKEHIVPKIVKFVAKYIDS